MEKTKLRGVLSVLIFISTTAVCHADEQVKPLNEMQSETAYFLSSSIPEKELTTLMKAAEARHIPVYFRGLISNDMKVTTRYMLYLVKKYKVTGIQIDPVRFKQYGIDKVPALVKRCGTRFDVVYGNIAVKDALTLIDDRGECGRP